MKSDKSPLLLPRVVIGIPTFNRVGLLQRAVDSALAQDYPNLAVIISDNASTDDTASVVRRYVDSDTRVSCFRHPINVGATRNFSGLLERADGELFMWLADDDWLDPGYVSSCAATLRERGDVVAVGGVARYYQGDTLKRLGRPIVCLDTRPRRRVFDYYRQVDDNGIFYGLMRRPAAARTALVNCLGGDWLFLAAIAYQGRILTNADAKLHRSLGGTSETAGKMAAILDLPSWQARMPITFPLAACAARDILSGSAVYRDASYPSRLMFSVLVSCWICLLKPAQELRRRWQNAGSKPVHLSGENK